MLKCTRYLAIALLAVAMLDLSCGRKPPADADQVTVNGKAWNVELALTPGQHSKGLGGRSRLAENAGMLFVFPDSRVHEFWMKDCLISLDIAFIGADRKVKTIHTMLKEPGAADDRLKLYSSNVPVQYALEVPEGALGRAGVKVGDDVTFSPHVEGAIKARTWMDR